MAPLPSFADLQSGMSRRRLRRRAVADLDAFLAGSATLEFPAAPDPAISAIVILHNQAPLTFRCLASLHAQTGANVEVIIVDNASTDRTHELLGRVSGVTVVRNTGNEGFLRAANRATGRAQAPRLAFVNSDAFLPPDALARAAARLERDASLGIVGPRIVLPSGRLQEAGPVVWRDAKAIGFGVGRRPDAAPFRIERDVDYVCGAFLTVNRTVFEGLGGFDEHFAPAYYEEMDLCFRARAAGYRVLYDPEICAVHLNFGSGSPFRAIRRMLANRRKMAARHRAALTARPSPSPANYLRAHRGRRIRQWILIVTDPAARQGGLPAATLDLVRRLLDAGFFASIAYADELPVALKGRFWPGSETAAPDPAYPAATPWAHFDAVVATDVACANAVAAAIPAGQSRMRILIWSRPEEPGRGIGDATGRDSLSPELRRQDRFDITFDDPDVFFA